jgi:hypothetical protein
MLKKLFNVFKKKEEPVVEPVVETDRAEWTNDVYVIESVDEEQAKDFDVETSLKFEIYMGETEETVTLVNDGLDFSNLDEAKAYATYIATRDYKDKGVTIFIHEETIDENGQPVTNRHY